MRIYSFLLLIFLTTACARAETPWEKYLLEPTPKNARLVSAIEYSDDTDAFYSDIHLLEVQVSAGDVEAFELVLRLAEQADGGDLRDLKVVASRSIRSHPALLLAQFESDPRFTNLLTGILVTVGEEYIDRPRARRYELQARRDALNSVDLDSKNAGLTRLLEILDEEIESLGRATANAECPKWAADDETCPIVGPYEDVFREFYFEGTGEAHLVGILVFAGPKMVPSIVEVIEDRHMFARRYAISALGLLKQRDALPALTDILDDETETDYFRSDALQAIYVIDAGVGQIAASELLNNPDLPDDKLKLAAIEVLEHPERIPQEWKRH